MTARVARFGSSPQRTPVLRAIYRTARDPRRAALRFRRLLWKASHQSAEVRLYDSRSWITFAFLGHRRLFIQRFANLVRCRLRRILCPVKPQSNSLEQLLYFRVKISNHVKRYALALKSLRGLFVSHLI